MAKLRVLGINGSPRKGGNTELLVKEVLAVLSEQGIKTEFFQLGGRDVNPCVACMKCKKVKDGFCQKKNSVINECIEKMMKADAIIIGSPVYFTDVTPEVKALIDVAGYASCRGCSPGRGHSYLRYHKPFLPYKRDDCTRIVVLEHWHRP